MAQPKKQQSPTNSERSSVESWIDVNNSNPTTNKHHHHGSKRAVVPNSSLPMGVAPTVQPHTPIHQIHPRHNNLDDDEIPQQIPAVHPMMLPHAAFAGCHLFGGVAYLPGGEQSVCQQFSQDDHPPTLASHHEEEGADKSSLLVGSTSLSLVDDSICDIKPVSAFVGDLVRSCCTTERHALLRGHADCLVSYHKAAEHWQLAREVRGKYINMNNVMITNEDCTTTPTHTIDTKQPTRNGASHHHHHHHHPFGVIGERTCGTGGFQKQQQQRNNSILPSPDTPSTIPTPPHGGFSDMAMASPCHGRNQMVGGTRFGPASSGDFRPMISVVQGANQGQQQYNNNSYNTIEPTDVTIKPQHAQHAQPPLHPLAVATREEERVAMGYSPRYQGNIYLEANRCADIPDELNTSLFLIHLPATTTTHDVLAAMHAFGPTGRVFALHINAPEPGRGNPGCAAKVVFFTRAAAHVFFDRCQRVGFYVGGRRAHVTWNRIKTAERPDLVASDASRVLLIAGPRDFVNPRTLTAFFRTKLEFQIDEVLVFHDHDQKKGRWGGLLPSPPQQQVGLGLGLGGSDDAIVEYRFGSFRCQAQAAQMAISRMLPHVRCFFGEDPLAPEAWRRDEYTRRTCESHSEAAILDSLRV